MNIETLNFASFKMAAVGKDTGISALLLSADIHTENSSKQQVLFSIYASILQAGAGNYNRDDFLYEVSVLGASLEVSVDEGRLILSLQVLQSKLNKALRLLELMISEPTFSESELERIKKRLVNNLILYKENSRLLAFDNLKKELFKKTDRKYRFSPDELSATVNDISVVDLKQLHEKFKQSYWKAGVGGNENTIKSVTKFLEKIKLKEVAETRFTSLLREVKENSLVTLDIPSKENIDVSIGAVLPFKKGDRELVVFNFGLAVLGNWGGFGGRLMSIVREKEGLTYGIYARSESIGREEVGFWRIFTFFSSQDIEKGLTSVLREVRRIKDKGITSTELTAFRQVLRTREKLAQDSLVAMVQLAHSLVVLDMEYEEFKQEREVVYTCTQAEINKNLKQYLKSENLIFSLAGPLKKVKLSDLEKVIKSKK